MSGLEFDAGRHRYVLDGAKVPSVTSILGKVMPKPGLAYWAARRVAEVALDDLDGLVSRLETFGPDETLGWLKRAPWRERDAAAVRGTAVHALGEQVIRGEQVEVPAQLASYVMPYVDLADELGIEPINTEVMLANRTLWYSGTADLFATIDGEVWCLDLKTSKGVHGDYGLQLAAYAKAEALFIDGDEFPVPEVSRIGVVHLQSDHAELHEFPLAAAWDAFQVARNMLNTINEIKSWETK